MGTEERVRLLLCGLVAAGGVADTLELRGHRLLGVSQNLDKVTGMRLLVLSTLGVRAEQAHCEPLLARTARSPDSVHVVLDRQRKGVVDNELDVLHIEAAARHIRGNEGRLLASLEVRDRLCSGVLRHVTLQGACLRVALLLEEALEPRRFLLVQTEDDDLLVRRIVRLQDGEKPAGLVLVVVQHLNLLPNRGVRDKALVHRADADMHRVLQELRRQGMN
mmetsp:Transcript_70320/g.197182  ORF Transcript_70320/g.197182 Transcript_70320/m.197182 type:complete len:220 (-) Transcript_70320:918-1577(-)